MQGAVVPTGRLAEEFYQHPERGGLFDALAFDAHQTTLARHLWAAARGRVYAEPLSALLVGATRHLRTPVRLRLGALANGAVVVVMDEPVAAVKATFEGGAAGDTPQQYILRI